MQCNCTTAHAPPPPWQLAAVDTVEELANIGSYTWHPATDQVTWSDQLYRLFGVDPSRVEPSLPAFLELVHEDDKALVARAIACAQRREIGHPVELRIRRRDDGRERWLKIGLASKSPRSSSDAAFFGIVVDVTDERTFALTLRHATDALDRVESTGNLGSFEYDVASDELIWSDQMSRIHGLEPGPARPNVRTILEVVHPDDRQKVAERLLSAFGGDPANDLHYRVVLGDGVERHLAARLVGLRDENGELTGVWGVASDVTEQRRNEELLRHSQRLEGIGRLAGGIAHDFNNLLLVIMATTELARRSTRNDAVQPELDRIEEAAIRAADLVRQLLLFARGRPSAPQVLDFAELLPQSTRLLERLLGDEIELELDFPNEKLWPIFADRGQIEQVMLNLAINARDAMPDGGKIEISARNAWIKHPAQADEDCHVVIRVKDSGTGMDAPTLARIFDPFFTTKTSGTGLGLTTCKSIVESAGGFVRARSTVGAGSTFELFFPRAAGSPYRSPAAGESTLARGSERVLVVDDSAAVRSVAQRLLELLGYTVVTARSASEARVALSSSRAPIDLLISDLAMPRESGAAFVRRLRASHPGLRVLLISARAEIAKGIELEFGPVLAKPFTLEQLARAVRVALDSQR